MKKFFIPIAFIIVSCQQQPKNTGNSTQTETPKDTVPVTHSSVPQNIASSDSISFEGFLKLVRNEEHIPRPVIQKFVRLSDNSIFGDSSSFIGKAVVATDKYYLLHLKQGTRNNGHDIYLTYSAKTLAQIDGKSFLYYCYDCSGEVLVSLTYFLDTSFKEIIVDYYKPTRSRTMPDPDSIKTLRTAHWKITPDGKIVLK